MKPSTTFRRRVLFACIAACIPVAAIAQATPQAAVVTPFNPFLGDHIGLPVWDGQCPEPAFSGRAAPTIRQTGFTPGAGGTQQDAYEYEVIYPMRTGDICLTPIPPAGFSAYKIDIGALPVGHHTFNIQGVDEEDEVFVEYSTETHVGAVDSVRTDVSGFWYAPEQNGRGVAVVQSGLLNTVYWAIHDTEGNPAWVLLNVVQDPAEPSNILEGTAIYTHGDPLAPGAAELAVADWGTVTFTYERCGHATLAWDSDDEAVEDGSLDLVQVTVPNGVYVCDVENAATSVDAEWLED